MSSHYNTQHVVGYGLSPLIVSSFCLVYQLRITGYSIFQMDTITPSGRQLLVMPIQPNHHQWAKCVKSSNHALFQVTQPLVQ